MAAAANAQEASRSIRISFLPPPLEGTISLGIYDSANKLVRVLHREAELEDFTIGNDALSTTWDGKNAAGEDLPPGKYHARGYAVGEVEVEGVGFFFNDFVTEEDSPHLSRISAIAEENGHLVFRGKLASGQDETFACNDAGKIVGRGIGVTLPEACDASNSALLIDPLSSAPGAEGTRWIVDRMARDSTETNVQQRSASGELLRRLSLPAGDPQPRAIAAQKGADGIFLLEENSERQRVRALSLHAKTTEGDQPISDWKVRFEKKIVAHRDFTLEKDKPVVSGGKAAPEKISIKLQANPLQNDERSNIELSVGYDAEGSYLQTADGLPLRTVSETPFLKRAVLSPRNANSVDVFQDDEAVVEQFRVTGLDQMMAFDCGEFELK